MISDIVLMQIKDSRASASNDDSFSGLKAAVFVAAAMCKSMNKKLIIDKFHGDEKAVDMWVMFVRSNGWIVRKMEGWVLTEKGRFWFKSIMSSVSAVVLLLFSCSADVEISPLIVG